MFCTFSRNAIAEIVPVCRCEIVIQVAPDEVSESNRIFRSEWVTLPLSAEPFALRDLSNRVFINQHANRILSVHRLAASLIHSALRL